MSGQEGSYRAEEKRAAATRLRQFLDALDEQTRLPGEPPLREAVAQQARERLAEMRVSGASQT